MEERVAELERRLARAERRASQMCGLALAGALSALMLAAVKPAATQTDGSTVKAPFRVVDAQGKPLMEVHGERNGAQLALYNSEGWVGARMSFALYGPGLDLIGKEEGGSAFLHTDWEGARLGFRDQSGKGLAVLWGMKKDKELIFYGDALRPQLALDSGRLGKHLIFYDPEGKAASQVP